MIKKELGDLARPPATGWRLQFGKPTGFLGRLVGHLMAFQNKQRSEWVLSLLEFGRADRVLEVGFGSGMDIQRVSKIAMDGYVAGVDHSEVMVRQAGRRSAAAIAAKRVELKLGSSSHLPFPDASFDKAYAINSAQFWTGPEAFSELHRVLKPGGLVALAIQPRSKGATEETARLTGQSLVEALTTAGFSQIRLESKQLKPVSVVCAMGVR